MIQRNQDLSNSLAKFVQENCDCWDEKLHAVVYYIYDSTVQVGCS